MVDQLLIKQKVEVLEVVTGIETENKYEVLNSMGQLVSDSTLDSNSHWLKSSLANFNFQVYKAKEDSECCTRYFCDAGRWFELYLTTVHVNIAYIRCFDMNITDLMGQEVIHLYRPFRCQSCCFPCCCCLQVSSDNNINHNHKIPKLFSSPGDVGVQPSRYCHWNHLTTMQHYASKVSVHLTLRLGVGGLKEKITLLNKVPCAGGGWGYR